MADGFESGRTEAYFSGRLRPHPLPKRIRPKQPPAVRDDAEKDTGPQED